MFISLNKGYCVIDTDGEYEYNIIYDYLTNKCQYKMIDNNVTKSCSNFEVKETTYKRHFWFILDQEYDIKNILGDKYGFHFDILFDKVFEHTDNYEIKEFEPLVLGMTEITEILQCFNISLQSKKENIPDKDLEKIEDINKLKEYIECLATKRYDYSNWRDIGFALHSATNEYDEDELIELFNNWSSKDKKSYKGLKDVLTFWKGIKTNITNGLTLRSFYLWCKEDNEILYNKLVTKYSNKMRQSHDNIIIDINLWEILEDMNHSDMAKLYYKLNPKKYVYSTNLGWYEYNNYNILVPFFKIIPPSLLSDATNKLQDFIIQERNKLKPPNKISDIRIEEYEKQMKYYDNCMKLAKKGYVNVGNSSYVKNIIDYLSNLYNVDRLETLLDTNVNLLAFDNILFDYEIGQFRNIEPTDYITKTTKYKAPEKSVKDFDFINKLLYSIFENKEVVDYWLITTGLSLFGNKMESLYIHTGSGGNGKGLLSSILVKGMGDYMYCADNTFLTSVFKSGQPNPTLSKCIGIRYLLVSEPDDGSDDVKFNVDFIKMLTGGDIITTRDLFKSNVSYKPQFTPFVQCNNKPKLGKIDNGIKRRLKIINYPLKFVDKPSKNNERNINYSLKDKLTNDLYKQFILLLIDKAVENKNKMVIQPDDIKNQTKDYFDDNDPVKGWLNIICKKSNNDSDRIKTSELYNKYLSDGNQKISMVKFSEYIKLNDIEVTKYGGYMYFKKIIFQNIDI